MRRLMVGAGGIEVPVMRTLYATLEPYLNEAPAH